MKTTSNRIVLASIIVASSLSSGCALLGPLLGMLTGGGLMMTGQDSAQASAAYRVTTNPVYQDGSSLYGFYSDKSGSSH
jgi:hypothetical protein